MPQPNLTLMRRRPWVLILLAAFLAALVFGLAVYAPASPTGGVGRHQRILTAMLGSPTTFAIHVGVIYSAIGIALGIIPKLLRLAREVTSDDAS